MMNTAMNESSENVIKYPVAHIKRSGVDLVIVLLDASFGGMSRPAKSDVLRTLQQHAATAGLRGTVVPVWDNGQGRAEFLAEKQLFPCLKDLTLGLVQSNVNRELLVRATGPVNSTQTRVNNSPAIPVARAPGGTLSVVAEIEDCEVFVDGSLVGNIPAKVRIKEGLHTIEVTKAGFKTYKKEVEITDGSQILLRPVLERNDPLVSEFSDALDLHSALDQRGKVAEFQRKHRIGLITLLFTDMVGSTKLKQELGDREAVTLIQRHHSVVRENLSRFPTAEEISTAGDSFFLAFAKPSDAVKFSLLTQSKLRELARGSSRPLLDRIGIHVGEVFIEETSGPGKSKDLYGIQVDTSARVMSLGEGDQILMTRFAYDNAKQVLKGQQIEGIGPLSWVNHGPYCLKGVDEPLDICEVGEVGRARLKQPADSEKVQRHGSSEIEEVADPHVVISTRTVYSRPGQRPA